MYGIVGIKGRMPAVTFLHRKLFCDMIDLDRKKVSQLWRRYGGKTKWKNKGERNAGGGEKYAGWLWESAWYLYVSLS